jgi:hypothetical protein
MFGFRIFRIWEVGSFGIEGQSILGCESLRRFRHDLGSGGFYFTGISSC